MDREIKEYDKEILAAVEANQIVSQHPELSRKQISKYAATEVTEADTQAHLAQSRWSVDSSHDQATWEHFAFGMKAITDTLPHNSNLCLWKKIQSDHCPISSDAIARTEQLSHYTQARPLQCQTWQCPVDSFSAFAGQGSTLVLCYCRSRWSGTIIRYTFLS